MQMNHIAAKTPLNHLERLHSPRTFDRADCLRRYLALSGNDRFIPRSTWYQSFALGFGAGLRRSDADPSARLERRSGVLGPGAGGSGRESSLHWHLQLLHPGGRGGNPVLCQDHAGRYPERKPSVLSKQSTAGVCTAIRDRGGILVSLWRQRAYPGAFRQ